MRLSRSTAVAVLVLVPAVVPLGARAQEPIRVLRHAPVDTARSGDIITISFDRPVVGSLDRTPDPVELVHLDPLFDAEIQWRDPATLRIIPRVPLVPARRYRITVSNDFTAMDGGRLAAPYEFAIVTRGPRMLASSPSLNTTNRALLAPNGTLTLVYSAPVDTAEISRVARLEFAADPQCPRRSIRYAVRNQRPIAETDDWSIRTAGTWDGDADASRFRRVVEIRPRERIPEDCCGDVVISSLDPSDRAEIRYPIATPPPFGLLALFCAKEDCAAGAGLHLSFAAPVRCDSMVARIHLEPAVPFTIVPTDEPTSILTLQLRVRPRTAYRVRVDASANDIFGRRIQGKLDATVTAGDRHPALGHQLGFFTVSRSRPRLRITHVNVDSAELVIVPIPDSLRAMILGLSTDPDSAARMIARLRDTVTRRVALAAPFNVERITDVPIPPSALEPSKAMLFAIRARRTVPVERPDTEQITVLGGDANEPPLPPRAAIVQLTDLVAHARVSDGSGSVLVTDANTGRPVRGATVTTRDVHDSVVASGVTDETGIAGLVQSSSWHPPRAAPPEPDGDWGGRTIAEVRVVEVSNGADRSVTPIVTGRWESRADATDQLGGWFVPANRVRASVFSDRGIYRPGEKVYYTAIVRHWSTAGLRAPIDGDTVRIHVTHHVPGVNGPQTVRDTVVHVGAYGTVADSFALGRSWTLGTYTVRVDADLNGWTAAGATSFQLAEYRAPEFEASLALDTVVRFLGDTVLGRATGRYYFGAPMAGAVLHWSAFTSDAGGGVPIPGLPAGYSIGESYIGGPMRSGRGDLTQGVDTLDASGSAVLRIPTSVGSSTSPAHINVSIAVDDLNRQSVAASAPTTLHSSSFYVAVRDSGSSSWYWAQSAPRHISLLAVRPDGRHVRGVRVGIAIVRHRRSFTETTDGSMPSQQWTTDTIGRDSATTSDEPTRYVFTPTTAGWYDIVLTASDERGRPAVSSVGGYVVGQQWTPWTDNPLRVAMTVDSEGLALGDTMVIRFVSPFKSAEAWVTVEREEVLAQRRLRVASGETTVRIPVTERFIPGAQVSVLLVDSTSVWRTDSAEQRFRAGYQSISVDQAPKVVTVVVQPSTPRYAPGDSARITVAVRDHAARPVPSQVTLWAVDEGVLALTGYARPDPLDALYSTSSTALQFASTAMTLASMKRFRSPPGWVLTRSMNGLYGSEAASPALRMSDREMGFVPDNSAFSLRADFRTTAFYIASRVTDANGQATVSVKLPDNLTTYRLIAVAVTQGDRFGSGESSIILTKPLFARVSFPRFLRTGDVLRAGVVVNNTTSDSLSARIRASSADLARTGDSTAMRTVGSGRGSEVRFDWRADASPGSTAVVRFDVVGGQYADAVQASMPIRPPYALRYHAIAGVASGTSTVRMMLPSGIDHARSRLTLRVGDSPAPIIRASYAQLDVYPFDCSEQLTSTGQVVLAMLKLQRAGVVDSTLPPTAHTLRGRAQYIVDELERRQGQFGGIGYWTAGSWTSWWLSSYAGMFLLDARAAGLDVNPRAIERIAKFVAVEPDTASSVAEERYGTRSQRERAIRRRLSEHLAALHFLRRVGSPDTLLENSMIAESPRMTWEDRVWLAELLATRSDRSAARAQLDLVWRDVEMAGTRVDIPDSLLQTLGFPSHVRPVARLFRATAAVQPDHPRLAALIERVVQQGRASQQWAWNTQDYAVVATTLADLAVAQHRALSNPTLVVRSARSAVKHRVLLAGSTSPDSTVALDGLLERDGEWMALPVSIASSGGPVFYVLTVEEVPLTAPTAPDARGMVVERWFERFDDGRTVTEVKEGELVRARLRVTVPSDREFVAVEDLLPAGLEVVDVSLRTSSIGPFESETSVGAERAGNRANGATGSTPWLYGRWVRGWWSPWEHTEMRDDRVVYFARMLWKGSYTATYVARATTAGTFVRPPAHAEEMYNQSLGGRSDGGVFRVIPK